MALVQNSLTSELALHPFGSKGEYDLHTRARALRDGISMPKRFPNFLSHPLAWVGSSLSESTYVHNLKGEDRLEIDNALTTFKAYELDGDLVNRENFPLPNLEKTLEGLSSELHDGKGFFVLRGIEMEKYSVEDGMIIYLGIQAYIAEQRARQDDRGNMVVHIISDLTPDASPIRSLHSRHSKRSIAFHTEETGDIIAWQTRSTAARGGKCIIASAYTIYNILATTCPDIIRTLARPDWPFALPSFHLRPLLYFDPIQNHLIINFNRTALLGSSTHSRDPTLPCVTPQQLEALDTIESLARATELEITTRKGDLHFVNNLAVLHRRSGFVDEPGVNRHLVRMRLRSEGKGWSIPDELKQGWEEVFGEEGDRVWHVEPMPEAFFPLRKYLL